MQKLIRFVLGLVSGATVGLLCAKKSGTELRKELKGKTPEEKAKIIGNELMGVGKDISEILKDLPENEQVKELTKLGKKKLNELIEKANKSSCLKEHMPKIRMALKEIESGLKEKGKELKKHGEKLAKKGVKGSKEIKKHVAKTVNNIKKKIS